MKDYSGSTETCDFGFDITEQLTYILINSYGSYQTSYYTRYITTGFFIENDQFFGQINESFMNYNSVPSALYNYSLTTLKYPIKINGYSTGYGQLNKNSVTIYGPTQTGESLRFSGFIYTFLK